MKDCVFCNGINKEKILFETSQWIAVYDGFPISNGHTLLIPKEHYETFFDLPNQLIESLPYRINEVKEILDNKFHPNGYNIGINCGRCSGQTVMHCHIHIIPRYNGDVEDPRGGIRGCIPSKMHY